jgi:hypothetical protein
MIFSDTVSINSESSTKTQTVAKGGGGWELISYMLETRGDSNHIVL